MNFYKRFVGDIQAKTGHLSLAEFGAYDRLLDHYYSTERGLPDDLDRCCGIARAASKEDRKAVAFVLQEFFKLGETGLYHQRRADEMIAEAQPKIEAARSNGGKGGRPKKPKPETQEKPSGLLNENPNQTQSETESADFAKASQSQSQSIGIPPDVVNTETSVCVSGHTQISGFFKTAVEPRPGLDLQQVWEGFCDHYPEPKRTLAKWRQWWAMERIPSPAGQGAAPPVPAVDAAELTRKRIAEDDAKVVPMPESVRASLAALSVKVKRGADGGGAIAAEA